VHFFCAYIAQTPRRHCSVFGKFDFARFDW
jgi:hypothetical protein